VPQGREDAHEQMMAQLPRASGIEEHHQPSGAKVVPHRGLKMEAPDPLDANSRTGRLLSAHPRLLSRITNGDPR
jgi:hypothetical protein